MATQGALSLIMSQFYLESGAYFSRALSPIINTQYLINFYFLFVMCRHFLSLKRYNANKEGNMKRANNRTARILSLFPLVYIAQWWPVILFTLWGYAADPHISVVVVCLFPQQRIQKFVRGGAR